jgi:transcriptional regulator with XRE-family HTH domain
MESRQMTQSEFADYIELAPATLSSIFNGRTRPTLNVVEALKKKIPDISMDWLMFGIGDMYQTVSNPSEPTLPQEHQGSEIRHQVQNPMLDFDAVPQNPVQNTTSAPYNSNSVRPTRLDLVREEVKNLDKPQRRVLEIRVFYDDQTWETFVPAKK